VIVLYELGKLVPLTQTDMLIPFDPAGVAARAPMTC
jgi:hypothetical protein